MRYVFSEVPNPVCGRRLGFFRSRFGWCDLPFFERHRRWLSWANTSRQVNYLLRHNNLRPIVIKRSGIDIPLALKGEDSLGRRLMSQAERGLAKNVDSRIHIPVVQGAALGASPLSYSKVCDTFRPRIGHGAAIRADLGGKTLVHFFKPCTLRNRFVVEHVSERRPACIKNRLGHASFGQSGGVDIAHRDIIKFPDDAGRELVMEVASRIGNAAVKMADLAAFFARCALASCSARLRRWRGFSILVPVDSVASSLIPRSMPTPFSGVLAGASAISITMFRNQFPRASLEKLVPSLIFPYGRSRV